MATVTGYARPSSMPYLFELLERPGTVILGGGTRLGLRAGVEPVEVLDLQALRLDGIEAEDDSIVIGAMTTLQDIADHHRVPAVVREAARRERPSTVRTQATIGGCIATGDADSELLASLLVHETVVDIGTRDRAQRLPLEAVLATLPLPRGSVILGATLRTAGVSATARVGRTRADTPIVAAVARDAAGTRRLALTGVATTPVLVDGPDDVAPTGDFRGSGEYRRELAAVLLTRAVEALA